MKLRNHTQSKTPKNTKKKRNSKNYKRKTISCTLDQWVIHEQKLVSEAKDGSTDNGKQTSNSQTTNEKSTENKAENTNVVKKPDTLKRHPSGSFLKYGVKLPTIEDAVNCKQKLEEFKQAINDLELVEDFVEPISLNMDEPKPVEVLDCKHLTDDQLKTELELNYQYLYNIVNGTSKSERHDKFQKEDFKNNFTTEDLKYNTSMITFTFEQKELLLSYLYEKFDNSEFGNNTQYFFKVLLPELCTKIFMDTHKMNYSEAVAYLDYRPVD